MAKGLKGYKRGDAKVATRRLVAEFHFDGEEEIQEFLDEMEYYEGDSYDMDTGYDSSDMDVGADLDDFYDLDYDDDFGTYGFSDFGFKDQVHGDASVLVEDDWDIDDCYDAMDKGVGYLRYNMESVKPADVAGKDITWVAQKYTLLSVIVLGGLLSHEFIASAQGLLLGRYAVALHRKLTESQIDFKVFGGLTEKGWETFRGLTADHCVGGGHRSASTDASLA